MKDFTDTERLDWVTQNVMESMNLGDFDIESRCADLCGDDNSQEAWDSNYRIAAREAIDQMLMGETQN